MSRRQRLRLKLNLLHACSLSDFDFPTLRGHFVPVPVMAYPAPAYEGEEIQTLIKLFVMSG